MILPHPVFAVAGPYGHGIDVLAVALLAFGAVRGGFRGLTGEVARIAGFVAAVGAGFWVSTFWGDCAARWLPAESQAAWRGLVVVVGLVVSAVAAGQLVRWAVDRFLRLLLDQPANAVLGVVAGGIRAALLVVVLFFLASFVAFGESGRVLFKDSAAGRMALPAVQRLRWHLGPFEPGWAAEIPEVEAGEPSG